MKKLLTSLLIITLSLSAFLTTSCKNEKIKKEFDNVKTELDKIKGQQTESSSAIEDLREEIKALEVEKQKLIAEKHRLNAEIIELKIKDYGVKNDNSAEAPSEKAN